MSTEDLKKVAKQALGLMDLTSLNDDDTDDVIRALCKQAVSASGQVAAVCIYPQFIPIAREQLNLDGFDGVAIATVTNFPSGSSDIDLAVNETRSAVEAGADEVDVVFPWRALKAGDETIGKALVESCKVTCGNNAKLKVIIESGELESPELIEKASEIAINAGADFIKTSTGKVPVNATLEAATIMLGCIKRFNPDCGFKAAGGVRTTEQAAEYITLANKVMGEAWVVPEHFRFGASGLLGALQASIQGTTAESKSSY